MEHQQQRAQYIFKTLYTGLCIVLGLMLPVATYASSTNSHYIWFGTDSYNVSSTLDWSADGLNFDFGTVGTKGSAQTSVAVTAPGCVYYQLIAPDANDDTPLSAYYDNTDYNLGEVSTPWCLFQYGGTTCDGVSSESFNINEFGFSFDNDITYTLKIESSGQPQLLTAWQQNVTVVPATNTCCLGVCVSTPAVSYSYTLNFPAVTLHAPGGYTYPNSSQGEAMPTEDTDYSACQPPSDVYIPDSTGHGNKYLYAAQTKEFRQGPLATTTAKCTDNHTVDTNLYIASTYGCCKATVTTADSTSPGLVKGRSYWFTNEDGKHQECPSNISVTSDLCRMRDPVYLLGLDERAAYHLKRVDCKITSHRKEKVVHNKD